MTYLLACNLVVQHIISCNWVLPVGNIFIIIIIIIIITTRWCVFHYNKKRSKNIWPSEIMLAFLSNFRVLTAIITCVQKICCQLSSHTGNVIFQRRNSGVNYFFCTK
jgi:hypothetical protein